MLFHIKERRQRCYIWYKRGLARWVSCVLMIQRGQPLFQHHTDDSHSKLTDAISIIPCLVLGFASVLIMQGDWYLGTVSKYSVIAVSWLHFSNFSLVQEMSQLENVCHDINTGLCPRMRSWRGDSVSAKSEMFVICFVSIGVCEMSTETRTCDMF